MDKHEYHPACWRRKEELNPSRMRDTIAEHRQIIAAAAARDKQGARDAMQRHIRNTAACAGIVL